jgi:hypothetical protein
VRASLVIAVVSRAAAHALGYGANWITEWYAYDRGVLDALGLAPRCLIDDDASGAGQQTRR